MSGADCTKCGWPLGVNPAWCEECALSPRWDPATPYRGSSDRPLFPGDRPLIDEEIRKLGWSPTPRGWILNGWGDPEKEKARRLDRLEQRLRRRSA